MGAIFNSGTYGKVHYPRGGTPIKRPVGPADRPTHPPRAEQRDSVRSACRPAARALPGAVSRANGGCRGTQWIRGAYVAMYNLNIERSYAALWTNATLG